MADQPNSSFRTKPCKFFATNSCKKGNACPFSHEKIENPKFKSAPITAERKALLAWRYDIPKDTKDANKSRPLGNKVTDFIQNALKLVHSGPESMQEVVMSLSSEGGLYRIGELLDVEQLPNMSDTALLQCFEARLLPLMQLLAHEDVLMSAIVETRHATILNYLYGVNGHRAVVTFGAVARALAHDPSQIGPCLITLSSTLEVNGQAQVNRDLLDITGCTVALAVAPMHDGFAQKSLERLRLRLGLAAGLTEAICERQPVPLASSQVPKFNVRQDQPGMLSADGQRHDNDSAHIHDIAILPSIAEIMSDRAEYLPQDDPSEWHLKGIDGLIDRHFRLLREDTVGQLRDAAKLELERLRSPTIERRSDPNGLRTRSYTNVRLLDYDFDSSGPMAGLRLLLTFDQPSQLLSKSTAKRQEWWESSRRLESDALLALLGGNGFATFVTICGAPPFTTGKPNQKPVAHDRCSKWMDPRSASVVARLAESTSHEITKFLDCFSEARSSSQASFTLLEFPGVILPAFQPTLAALQSMAGEQDVPFTDILAPQDPTVDAMLTPAIPAYASRQGFRFNLSAICNDQVPMFLDPKQPLSAEALEQNSSLDYGQAQAVIAALKSSFALIQGPPGTGKSYTGEAIMKVLLHNKKAANLHGVLYVTFTNHALDQGLISFLDAGVKQIIRLGSRSKSERLLPLNLRNVIKNYDETKPEHSGKNKAYACMKSTSEEISVLLGQLRHASDEASIRSFLRDANPDHHRQLFQKNVEVGEDDDGNGEWHTVGKAKGFKAWLRGGNPQMPGHARDWRLLQSVSDLSSLSRFERQKLHKMWLNAIIKPLHSDMIRAIAVFEESKHDFNIFRQEIELRALNDANIVGVTTSGLARNLTCLRRLRSKVLVIEEAGEVLEAHNLTALLPCLEHVILIGDHQQLRPKAQNYDLSCENPRSHVSLDISLFERLVQPRPGFVRVPYSTLNVQRRMHPSISDLIRQTSYPTLTDETIVQSYPHVVGLKHRLFWFNHKQKEDAARDEVNGVSHTNTFEVEMVAALVHHLVNQGVYQASDIAVLTPYLGQLRLLNKALKSFSKIVLKDRDVDELANDETEDSQSGNDTDDRQKSFVTRGTLLQAVRLASIDNFQGEEAKVVVISLVRSNDRQNCGFLRTPNRINVTLSRAKHGMYIIGNATTAASVPMWSQVIEQLQQKNCIGPALDLCCPRHPQSPLRVRQPDDFVRLAPEAGCELLCVNQLACGHACVNKCHADKLHDAVICLKPCTRAKKGCTHPCRNACGHKCETRCIEKLSGLDIQLSCGHVVHDVPCWQYQDMKSFQCKVGVTKSIPGCDHQLVLQCSFDVSLSGYDCQARCGKVLDCGHVCQKACFECRPREAGNITKEEHGQCKKSCDRPYTNCRHSCRTKCHGDEPCPLCTQACEVQCRHGKCRKKCFEPCAPCAEETCASRCEHSACNMPCAAPCDWVPCSVRCQRTLSCGHQCPSLCGSECPSEDFCQICAHKDIRDLRADFLMMSSYGEVELDESPCIFTECGHIFTVESLDGVMSMGDYYNLNASGMPESVKTSSKAFSYKDMKRCPDCRGSLSNLARYGRVVRRALLDENTKKFISWSNSAYVTLAERLQKVQGSLLESRNTQKMQHDCPHIENLQFSSLKRIAGMVERYRQISSTRFAIACFAAKVGKEEQPFQRVRTMVEVARHRAHPEVGPEAFHFDDDVLQTRGYLLAASLEIRCELNGLEDFISIWSQASADKRPIVQVDLSESRTVCKRLHGYADRSQNLLQVAEGHVYWARFAALECRVLDLQGMGESGRFEELKGEAFSELRQAEQLCTAKPGQTRGIGDEAVEVRRMLEEPTYQSVMRMVVQAMGKEFSGTGHWYRCVNGHPFTIGECGMPMQEAECPQCGERIGGRAHQSVAGVQSAHDIEREFQTMRL